jgi:hypothetical protein
MKEELNHKKRLKYKHINCEETLCRNRGLYVYILYALLGVYITVFEVNNLN